MDLFDFQSWMPFLCRTMPMATIALQRYNLKLTGLLQMFPASLEVFLALNRPTNGFLVAGDWNITVNDGS